MNRRRANFTLFLLLLVVRVGAAQPTDPQAIVDQFYPQKYIDDANRLGEKLNHETCYAIYQVLPTGDPQVIIAGYADGSQGTVKVLSRQASGVYTVTYEPSGLFLGGTACNVELIDIDGDGTREVHVSFGSVRAVDGDWIFKWDGSQLTPLGPLVVRKGVSHNKFSDTFFEDIYHDGTLQVNSLGGIPPTGDGAIPDPIRVLYRLVDGKFVLDSPVAFKESYVRTTGAPQPESSFAGLARGSKGPYTLMIVNGDKDGSGRVSSAFIAVNGTTMVYPSQFNQQVESFSVPLRGLQPENTITVQLDGKPGAHIQVVLKDQTPDFFNQ